MTGVPRGVERRVPPGVPPGRGTRVPGVPNRGSTPFPPRGNGRLEPWNPREGFHDGFQGFHWNPRPGGRGSWNPKTERGIDHLGGGVPAMEPRPARVAASRRPAARDAARRAVSISSSSTTLAMPGVSSCAWASCSDRVRRPLETPVHAEVVGRELVLGGSLVPLVPTVPASINLAKGRRRWLVRVPSAPPTSDPVHRVYPVPTDAADGANTRGTDRPSSLWSSPATRTRTTGAAPPSPCHRRRPVRRQRPAVDRASTCP